jgi:peptide-methionine (R)-S-oxide reductase
MMSEITYAEDGSISPLKLDKKIDGAITINSRQILDASVAPKAGGRLFEAQVSKDDSDFSGAGFITGLTRQEFGVSVLSQIGLPGKYEVAVRYRSAEKPWNGRVVAGKHLFYDGNQNQDYDQYVNRGTIFPATDGKWSQLAIPSSQVFQVLRLTTSVFGRLVRLNHMSAINEDELKARLDPLSYEVLRNGATERPFTGEYTDTDKVGSYRCKACSAELFKSETKFHSGCGWPSFYAPTADDAVVLIEDRSLAPRVRTEVRCANCDSHLGHVFEGEGYEVPTDQRWCINSVALILEEK